MTTINTFQQYTSEPYALSFEQMQELHNELISEIATDSDALELYDKLIEVCNQYAMIRASWVLLSREDKIEKDSSRTSYHNSVIIHFNMLSRYLRMQSKAASWRDKLGYEEDNKYCRKTIGDFCCYLVFINSLCAR